MSRSSRNFFVAEALNRRAQQRLDTVWLESGLNDARTRIIPVWRSRNLFDGPDSLKPVLLSAHDVRELWSWQRGTTFLGEWSETLYFMIELSDEDHGPAALGRQAADFLDLRNVGAVLDPGEGALLAYARAMSYWHRRHRYCGDCGSETLVREAGHCRVCCNARCGQKHFPRTDPAVIVLVTSNLHGGEERCLLGRQAVWPARMYSTIAGFVEPGESLEDAVVREVAEETAVVVEQVEYHSSQPWPFPSSLMLGFCAKAQTDRICCADQELEDARWLSRAAIVAELEAGTLRLPRRLSIAYRLIEDWFDAGAPAPLATCVARGPESV